MSHIHWVPRGTGTPKDKDEVNRRDVYECDTSPITLTHFTHHFLEVIGSPSMIRLTRKTAALVRGLPTFALSCERPIHECRCDERLKTVVFKRYELTLHRNCFFSFSPSRVNPKRRGAHNSVR